MHFVAASMTAQKGEYYCMLLHICRRLLLIFPLHSVNVFLSKLGTKIPKIVHTW